MKCGFARRDVTPEAGVFIAGNGEFKSIGINDPLFVRAVVLEKEGEWAALVSADLLGIEPETVSNVRKRLSAAGVGKPEHLFISCTHTHNGPYTRFNSPIGRKYYDIDYLARIEESISEAVSEADEAKEQASMAYARGYAFENMNRRIVTPDGKAHFYNPKLLKNHPEIARHVHGVADPELDALQFYSADGSILLTAVHYAAHPLTVGMYRHVISADYPGELVEKLEAFYEAPAVFFQGACGDLHSKGLFAGFERKREMAESLANETMRILRASGQRLDDPGFKVSRSCVKLPVSPGEQSESGGGGLQNGYYEVEMGGVCAGPVVFVTSPGELTNALGLEIKWNSSAEQTWVLFNTNCDAGYICPPRYYIEGGYEPGLGKSLRPEASDIVVGTALDLIDAVMPGQNGRRGRD